MTLPKGVVGSDQWQGTSPSLADAAIGLGSETPRATTAVLILHGMGQQVRFETLEQAAGLVHRAVESREAVTLRRIKLGDEEVTRAEVVYQSNGAKRLCHVYEYYWAPLTEGKVGIWDVVGFLWSGGVAGIRSALGRRFERWMFGNWHSFRIGVGSSLGFLVALVVLTSLVVINSVLGVAAAKTALMAPSALTFDLTVDLAAYLSIISVCVLMNVVAARLHSGDRAPSRLVVSLTWLTIWAAITATPVLALVSLVHSWNDRGVTASNWVSLAPSWLLQGRMWRLSVVVAVWAPTLVLSYYVRKFLVQYVGDVAAYVSAHKSSAFEEVRERIKSQACSLASLIYGARISPASFVYDRVVVVGHSLGSVIAYDTLNGLVRQDLLSGTKLSVPERTPLFVTFGSPLDKTAFIFRTHAKGRLDIREAAAATLQPMILDYAFRPRTWVNLHSPSDWIGGSLEYYDGPQDAAFPTQGVRNVCDPEATTPLAAHGEYWSGKLLARTLRDIITEA